jgi:hypothetical protein
MKIFYIFLIFFISFNLYGQCSGSYSIEECPKDCDDECKVYWYTATSATFVLPPGVDSKCRQSLQPELTQEMKKWIQCQAPLLVNLFKDAMYSLEDDIFINQYLGDIRVEGFFLTPNYTVGVKVMTLNDYFKETKKLIDEDSLSVNRCIYTPDDVNIRTIIDSLKISRGASKTVEGYNKHPNKNYTTYSFSIPSVEKIAFLQCNQVAYKTLCKRINFELRLVYYEDDGQEYYIWKLRIESVSTQNVSDNYCDIIAQDECPIDTSKILPLAYKRINLWNIVPGFGWDYLSPHSAFDGFLWDKGVPESCRGKKKFPWKTTAIFTTVGVSYTFAWSEYGKYKDNCNLLSNAFILEDIDRFSNEANFRRENAVLLFSVGTAIWVTSSTLIEIKDWRRCKNSPSCEKRFTSQIKPTYNTDLFGSSIGIGLIITY